MSPVETLPDSSGIELRLAVLRSVKSPLEKSSVSSICKHANISRDTFYRYFSSKYDICFWHGRYVQSLYLNQVGRTIDWQTGYYHDFRLLAEEKAFYKIALEGMGYNSEDFPEMVQYRVDVLSETLRDFCHVPLTEKLLFVVRNFARCETLITERWLRDGCQEDPRLLAEYMCAQVPHLLWESCQLPE